MWLKAKCYKQQNLKKYHLHNHNSLHLLHNHAIKVEMILMIERDLNIDNMQAKPRVDDIN